MVDGLDREYARSGQTSLPSSNPDLVYFLGDSLKWKCWSAKSKKLPTFRRNAGLFVRRSSMRLLTPQDKLAALGFPVSQELANAMLVNQFPCLDLERSASHVGNGMHLQNCAVVLLVGLSCFGKTSTPS